MGVSAGRACSRTTEEGNEILAVISKRTKLHNFLAEQQASIEKINADMRAKDGSLATCSSKLDALLKRYDLENPNLTSWKMMKKALLRS